MFKCTCFWDNLPWQKVAPCLPRVFHSSSITGINLDLFFIDLHLLIISSLRWKEILSIISSWDGFSGYLDHFFTRCETPDISFMDSLTHLFNRIWLIHNIVAANNSELISVHVRLVLVALIEFPVIPLS